MTAWLRDAIARALAPVDAVVDRYPRTVPDVVWTPWRTVAFTLSAKELAAELRRPPGPGSLKFDPSFYVAEALKQLEGRLSLASYTRPVDTFKLPLTDGRGVPLTGGELRRLGLFSKIESTYGVAPDELYVRQDGKTIGRIKNLQITEADNVACDDRGAKDREERRQAKNAMYRRWYGGTAPPLTIDVENGVLEYQHDPRLPPGGVGYQAQRWTIRGTVTAPPNISLWQTWQNRTTVRVRMPYDGNRNRRWTGPGYLRDIRVVEEPFGMRSYEVTVTGTGPLRVQ